ncbi:proximal sequence element A Pbp45 isoform X2 [Rhodnius prolixus]|uniref:proximal sequence element A Pbp45 isoform X2 n=1 Tax=Rhodnius prolixus TaxID=13249 RepID=UPI003D189912
MSSLILTGVLEDVEALLRKFVDKKNYTFESFTEVWKEMGFYYIFCGRPSVLEMKNFTRELLMMVKSFTLGDFTIWEKSGAVFLLYALYFIQPLSQQVTIRIEPKEWMELCDFAVKMKTMNMEVSFCFYKLVVNHAFDFVFSNKPFTIESMKEEEVVKKEPAIKAVHAKYKYDKFAMGSLLTSLGFDPNSSAQSESQYNEIKQLLNEKFPEMCNFETRRFAVNLLVPRMDTEEQSTPQDSASNQKRKKREKKTKKKFTDLSLFEDELLEESTLSMPNLLQDDSNLDGVDE